MAEEPTKRELKQQKPEQSAPGHSAHVRLCRTLLAQPPSQNDIALVTKQLGRYPRGMVAVGARCNRGHPLVTVTRPLLEGKIPFPTTFYLSHPAATKAISRLEAQGMMTRFNQELGEDDTLASCYLQAHEAYLDFRQCLAQILGDSQEHIRGISAGGMPHRVKCLHALVAQSLVMGRGVNPIGDRVLTMIKDDFDPQVCRCEI